jgi:peptidoglycan/LPS O-acetylase OafA/YrhL
MVVTGERQPERPAESPATPDEVSADPVEPRPELGHEPALDGLRGVAVAVVVLFHLGRLDGGFMGVDLFFLLSGFLITSLLLVEQHQTGRVNLGRFWARRARRLLPALFVVVAGVAVLVSRLTPAGERPGLRGDALSTLGYVANWHAMLADSSYWDMFAQASPLDHAWSLAIEEQFYVLWPLAFLGAVLLGSKLWARSGVSARTSGNGQSAAGLFGRLDPTARSVALISLTGAAVSFALLGALYEHLDTNRAYYGTDTRIGPTLLGAALAAFTVHRPRRDKAPAPWLELAAAAGLVWMSWSMVRFDGVGQGYYRGGLLVFALASLVVILAATGGQRGLVGQALSAPPLRALGMISYGVYLWHWPVIVYVDPAHRDWGWLPAIGWKLDAVRIVLSLALALASYWLVEMPIRRGKLRGRALWLAGAIGAAVAVGAALVATNGDAGADQEVDINSPSEISLPDLDDFPADAPRVLLVGDSGALVLGPELRESGEEQGVAVATATDPTCTIVYPEGVVVHRDDGTREDHGQCQGNRWADWVEVVEEFQPDAVVYYLGNAGMVEYELNGEVVDDCSAAYERYLRNGLTQEIQTFEANGADTYLLTSPYIGTLDETSAPRTDCRNSLYGELDAGLPTAEVLDLKGFVESGEAGEHDEMFVDWVHLSEHGGQAVSEWLFPQVLEPTEG